MKLSDNLKVALYGANPLYILIVLKKQMEEPGYNKQDLLSIVQKSIEYYESFGEEPPEPTGQQIDIISEGYINNDPTFEGF